MAEAQIPLPDPARVSQILTLADNRLFGFAEYGDLDGVPIVALHGTSDSRVSFENLHAAAHKLGVRLICPERPGIGLSSPYTGKRPGSKGSILGHADDIAELVAHLRVQDHWGVVGFSGGGPYALACAYRNSKQRGSEASHNETHGATSSETGKAGEAWKGLHGVGSWAGLGPVTCDSTGMFYLYQMGVTAIRWVPGFASLIFMPNYWAARQPGRAALERVINDIGKLVPPDDVALIQHPRTKEVMMKAMRNTYTQGLGGVANDVTDVVRGFKGKNGEWGWGFDVGDIDYKATDGKGIRLWYGTRDQQVPVHHGRALEKILKGSVYSETPATHFGMFLTQGDKILRDTLDAMGSGSTLN